MNAPGDEDDRTASLMTPAKLAQMRPRPAASPAAWLDRMAADAGQVHVVRIGELAGVLVQQARGRDDGGIAQALQALGQALPSLDFELLQTRGLLARMTGKSKSAGAEFAAQYERIAEAARGAGSAGQEFLKRQQAGAAAPERTLVEFEVEYHAIDKIIDQGARWLQDMRNQIKARQAEATTAEEQLKVREDAARCELLVARLKQLRAISTAAQQAHQAAQAVAQRRAAVAQVLNAQLAGDIKAWNVRLSPIAANAGDASAPALNLEGPKETHAELRRSVERAQASCAQLAADEAALLQGLEALRAQLPPA